jgi:hypothetical protein
VSKAEYEALQRRMQAADQRAAALEAEKRKLEDKDKDEKTKAEERAQELQTALEAAQEAIQSLRLENAFLRDSNFTWHDPSDVLRFVRDDDRVTIDDKGEVQGLEAALKSLAEKKPYLVKKDVKDEEPPGPSGSPQGSGRGKDTSKPERGKLLQDYPQLRGRSKTQPTR